MDLPYRLHPRHRVDIALSTGYDALLGNQKPDERSMMSFQPKFTPIHNNLLQLRVRTSVSWEVDPFSDTISKTVQATNLRVRYPDAFVDRNIIYEALEEEKRFKSTQTTGCMRPSFRVGENNLACLFIRGKFVILYVSGDVQEKLCFSLIKDSLRMKTDRIDILQPRGQITAPSSILQVATGTSSVGVVDLEHPTVAFRCRNHIGLYRFEPVLGLVEIDKLYVRSITVCMAISYEIQRLLAFICENGSIFVWNGFLSKKVRCIQEPRSIPHPHLQQCCFGAHTSSLIVKTTTKIERIMFDSPVAKSEVLYEIPHQSRNQITRKLFLRLLTRHPINKFHFVVVTNYSVMLFDERMPGEAILEWEHFVPEPKIVHLYPVPNTNKTEVYVVGDNACDQFLYETTPDADLEDFDSFLVDFAANCAITDRYGSNHRTPPPKISTLPIRHQLIPQSYYNTKFKITGFTMIVARHLPIRLIKEGDEGDQLLGTAERLLIHSTNLGDVFGQLLTKYDGETANLGKQTLQHGFFRRPLCYLKYHNLIDASSLFKFLVETPFLFQPTGGSDDQGNRNVTRSNLLLPRTLLELFYYCNNSFVLFSTGKEKSTLRGIEMSVVEQHPQLTCSTLNQSLDLSSAYKDKSKPITPIFDMATILKDYHSMILASYQVYSIVCPWKPPLLQKHISVLHSSKYREELYVANSTKPLPARGTRDMDMLIARRLKLLQTDWQGSFAKFTAPKVVETAHSTPNAEQTTSSLPQIGQTPTVQPAIPKLPMFTAFKPESDYHLVNKHSRVINKNALFDTILPEPQESMREYAILAKRAEMTSEETIPKPSVEIRSEDDDIMEL